MRHLSAKPRAQQWEKWVAPLTVSTLLSTSDEICAIARRTFNELELTGQFDCDDTDEQNIEDRENYERVLISLASGLSTDLHRLALQFLPLRVAKSIGVHCKGLRHLSLSVDHKRDGASFAAILKKCGRQLEYLEVDVETFTLRDSSSIGDNCKYLRRFKLTSEKIGFPLGDLWKSIGKNLSHVEIANPSREWYLPPHVWWFLHLPVLVQKCKDGLSLTLDTAICIACERGAEFFEQYSGRLKAITFRKFCLPGLALEEEFRAILVACPQAEVEMGRGGIDADGMVALGAKASNLMIPNPAYRYRDDVIDNLGRIGSACPNLKACWAEGSFLPVDVFRSLFIEPKPKLVRFCVTTFHWRSTAADTILLVLAEKVTTLEEFEYDGNVLPVHLLPPFVAANAGLKRVKVRIRSPASCRCDDDGGSPFPLVEWDQVVTPFLRGKSLAELDCWCQFSESREAKRHFAARETMCLPARAKGVSVSICGYQYW